MEKRKRKRKVASLNLLRFGSRLLERDLDLDEGLDLRRLGEEWERERCLDRKWGERDLARDLEYFLVCLDFELLLREGGVLDRDRDWETDRERDEYLDLDRDRDLNLDLDVDLDRELELEEDLDLDLDLKQRVRHAELWLQRWMLKATFYGAACALHSDALPKFLVRPFFSPFFPWRH